LTWRQLDIRHWSGTWETKIGGTVTRDGDGWVAYLRLEDPPGLTHHHRRPIRHGRGGAGGDRRAVGVPVTHADRQIWRQGAHGGLGRAAADRHLDPATRGRRSAG
jgi:hypothetical protein